MIYSLENKDIQIKISSLGGELRSAIFQGKERTWQNETGQWNGCASVLFPFSGRNKLLFEGENFGTHFHGVCINEEFELAEQDEKSVTLVLKDNERTQCIYPYHFDFFVKYTLRNDGYDISYTVKNHSDKNMPFSCGGHESFLLDGEVEEYYAEFDEDENFDFYIHGYMGFLTGEVKKHGFGRQINLKREYTDNGNTVILKNINSRGITLRRADNGERVARVTFNGFSNVLFWHPHGTRMICIEPWQCLPSFIDDICEFADRDGVTVLPANGEITFTRTILYLK